MYEVHGSGTASGCHTDLGRCTWTAYHIKSLKPERPSKLAKQHTRGIKVSSPAPYSGLAQYAKDYSFQKGRPIALTALSLNRSLELRTILRQFGTPWRTGSTNCSACALFFAYLLSFGCKFDGCNAYSNEAHGARDLNLRALRCNMRHLCDSPKVIEF